MSPARRLLVGGALAALLGAGLYRWREQGAGAASASASEPPPDLWQQRFATLDGRELRMADWRGRPLLLNFWATWCAPCITEMPLLDRFHAAQPDDRGVRTLALALDDAEKVRAFVQARGLRLPVAIAEAGGLALSKALGNDKGGLPYSIVFDRAGNIVHRKAGALEEADLSAWRAAVA